MRAIYCVLLLLCPYLGMTQHPVLSSISPGDKVPDIAFTNMLNYKSTSAKLDDFIGKLVILDFWATWCGNCIKKFNLLDSMQRTNPDKLQVILINTADTRDTKERIDRFLNRQRNSAGKKFIMPVVYNDSVTGGLFPHKFIPHYVWLNANQEVIAITGADQVTASNIQMLLNGQKVSLVAEGSIKRFEFNKPFFTDPVFKPASIQFRSSLLHFIPGMAPGSKFTRDSTSSRYSIINMPLRDILRTAYGISFEKDRVLLDVSDKLLTVLSPEMNLPSDSIRYCYEFIGPPIPLKEILVYIQQDMHRYFNLAIKTAVRPADCYLIQADSSLLWGYKTTGGKPANKLFDRDKRTMVNKPLATLAIYFDKILDRTVILKKTVSFNIDLELVDTPSGDIEALQAQLAKMGILLSASTSLTEQYIIYQTPKHKPL